MKAEISPSSGLSIPTFVWWKQNDSFVFVDHNDAALDLTGGASEQWIGQSLETVHGDSGELIDAIKNCFKQHSSLKTEITL